MPVCGLPPKLGLQSRNSNCLPGDDWRWLPPDLSIEVQGIKSFTGNDEVCLGLSGIKIVCLDVNWGDLPPY